MVKYINVEFGKSKKCWMVIANERNSLYFFELPYWKSLYVRHNLDVMHIEKNLSKNIIDTLLNIPRKMKDGPNMWFYKVDMGIQEKLAPQKRGNKRIYCHPTCYSLMRLEKWDFCTTLSEVKVPSGYSSIVKILVQMKGLKLINLKSHDCYTLMQQLLSIAIWNVLLKGVQNVITRLCYFFNAICSRVIDPSKLDRLQADLVETVCLFENYFPPTLFDTKVHLMMHLVREV